MLAPGEKTVNVTVSSGIMSSRSPSYAAFVPVSDAAVADSCASPVCTSLSAVSLSYAGSAMVCCAVLPQPVSTIAETMVKASRLLTIFLNSFFFLIIYFSLLY